MGNKSNINGREVGWTRSSTCLLPNRKSQQQLTWTVFRCLDRRILKKQKEGEEKKKEKKFVLLLIEIRCAIRRVNLHKSLEWKYWCLKYIEGTWDGGDGDIDFDVTSGITRMILRGIRGQIERELRGDPKKGERGVIRKKGNLD